MALKVSFYPENEEVEQKVATLLKEAEHFHRTGNYEKAEELYREVLRLDHQNSTAYHHLGIMALQGEQYELAEKLLKAASDFEPENTRYLRIWERFIFV